MKRLAKRLAQLLLIAIVASVLSVLFLLAMANAMQDPLNKLQPASTHKSTARYRVMT